MSHAINLGGALVIVAIFWLVGRPIEQIWLNHRAWKEAHDDVPRHGLWGLIGGTLSILWLLATAEWTY